MDKLTVLQDVFGYSAFREGQEGLIDAALAGRDVFGVMPTGGGKSLCYQIPALLFAGVTVVISPLISLMQDQVAALTAAGAPAAYLNSTQSYEQQRAVYADLRAGRVKLLYVAPERLGAEGFLRLAAQLPIAFVAVDEAHCISQWGQDFRPSYLKIAAFLQTLTPRPVVGAFTATATEAVRADVTRLLELREPLCVVTGFDRPNLRFLLRRPRKKEPELLALLRTHPGQSGIVYCATRKKVESVCELLQSQGVAATRYHAGLPEEERRRNQEDFVYDRCPVMVATNAFGMGIDKSNVRFVVHYNMPQSLEAYYQEAGRAGRDGEPADCVLLYSGGDVTTARFLIENGEENEALSEAERRAVQQKALRRLDKMVGYCKTEGCLRGCLLDYFGQSHPPRCGNCSNCLTETEERDATREAQMILSCVMRMEKKLGYYVGAGLLIGTLRGSREQRLLDLGLDALPTYGLMRDLSRETVQRYVEALEQQGYLQTEPLHRTLRPTERAGAVLFHGQRVTLAVKKESPAPAPGKKRQTARLEAGQEDGALFEALRALRTQLAREEHTAAYLIFSDAALRDMAARQPENREEFLQVSGVGEYKCRKYGKHFLACIAAQKEK